VGRVFHDRNGNGVLDGRERGVSNVAVSNGPDVVRTDRKGRYMLAVDAEDAIVFVVKPRGWATPVSNQGIPRFAYIHKPAGSPSDLRFPGVAPTGPLPASIDFPLTRRREPDAFRMVVFGDTQTATREEVDLLARDVVAELVGVDAAFGITLGDVVNDDLSLLDAVNAVVGGIGLPWYNVHGNHDMNYRATGDQHADETWERVYGPATYAFEYGPVHFIVLDDVIYQGWNTDSNEPGGYRGGLSDDALAFVRGYLKDVPEKHLVVLLLHIPLAPPAGFQVPSGYQVPERFELFRILSRFPHTFSISSHMHVQYHQFLGPEEGWQRPEPHHHLVHATACGSWWRGERDELGIPHATMRDGAPNGYSIVTFDGNDYAVRFRASRRPEHHQMRIVAPESVNAAEADGVEISVNVFAGSDRSRVEMRVADPGAPGEEGDWTPLRRVVRVDPVFEEIYAREESTASPQPLPPVPSPHLWVGNLPTGLTPGTTAIHVRETDMFGRVSRGYRLIRIE
jgi:hypothetical protein